MDNQYKTGNQRKQCKLRGARENNSDQVAIVLSSASDWLRLRCKFPEPIAELAARGNKKPIISSTTQTLNCTFFNILSCQFVYSRRVNNIEASHQRIVEILKGPCFDYENRENKREDIFLLRGGGGITWFSGETQGAQSQPEYKGGLEKELTANEVGGGEAEIIRKLTKLHAGITYILIYREITKIKFFDPPSLPTINNDQSLNQDKSLKNLMRSNLSFSYILQKAKNFGFFFVS